MNSSTTRVPLDAASQDLLERSREFVVGCGKSPCDCAACTEAMTILDFIATHLERADARTETHDGK